MSALVAAAVWLICFSLGGYSPERLACVKARSHCTLNAHSIRFNAHWFAFTLSRRECALSQSGLKPVWLNPLREVI